MMANGFQFWRPVEQNMAGHQAVAWDEDDLFYSIWLVRTKNLSNVVR